MRIKKFLAIILIAVLTLSQSIVLAAAEPAAGPVFEVGVEAATATPISLSPVLINKGDKVSVKLNIKKNDGISIASMYLEYDSSLFGVEKSDIKPAGLDDSFVFGSNIDNNGVKLYIYTTSVDTYYTGELCEITFTAKAGCSDASSELFHLRKAGQGKPITNTNFDNVELNSNAVNVLVHKITKDGIVTAPTCTADGYTTYTCDDCGAEIKTDTVKALGHAYDNGVVTTASTCTDKGVKTFTCTRTGCTDSYTEEVAALGHDLVSHEAKAPTCTEIGWDAYDTCSRCDYTTYVEKAALGHDLVNHEAKAPTCTEIGWDAYDTCSRCDYTTYVEKAALGHDIVNHEAKAPTCTEIGWDTYDTCSRCDYTTYNEIKATGHDYGDATCTQAATCKICGATSGTAIGHKWDDGVVTTAPTCTAKGVKTFTCTRANCGATYTEDIDMFDHEMPDAYTTNNNSTHSKKCANCDYTETADCAYTDVVTAPTCTEKGYTTHTCNVCGYSYVDTYVDALGHAYDNGVVTTEPTCTEKGVKTFTCTRTGCTASYTEEVAAKGHTDGTAEKTNVVEAKCTTEGSYDLVTKCTVCGEVTKTEHKTVAATGHKEETIPGTPATCVDKGISDGVKCSVCGEIIKAQTETDALGHSFGEWKTTIAPTYTSTGEAMRTCTRCGETETKVLPAYDEADDYLEIIAPATISAGSEVTFKAVRMPADIEMDDVTWTSSDESIISYYNGKFYTLGEGTVTLTAVTADGKLKATKTVTVSAPGRDVRIIKFVNINKMDYTVAGFYKVYNNGAIYWSRNSDCPFTVYTYTNFNYPTYIVYIDGQKVEADANGVYHIPAGTKNVIVTIAGAAVETETDDDGNTTGRKLSFWELIVRFFKKLFSIFKK